MGEMKIVLPDDLEEEFREEVFKTRGMKKGNLSKSVREAIEMWIEAKRKKRSDAAKKAWEKRREDKD